jgi:tetratricopeptide (TPR) repeat protein
VGLSEASRYRAAALVCILALAGLAKAQQSQTLEREFQAASADYDVGKYVEAAAALESLLPQEAKSFQVHELLGLAYAAQSEDAKAVEQLRAAVRLKPNSATARTNLAAALSHSGKKELAGEQFVKAAALAPHDYDANHNLGEFYIQGGKLTEARPLLEEAQRLRPDAYDNGFDLAQLYLLTGKLHEASDLAESLLKQKNTGELHNLLGQIAEKDGKFVAAANEYQAAARMDPSEDNLFDLGDELLRHWTYAPAIDVFERGIARYPNSPRLRIGLGVAFYSTGKYDDAVKSLLAAADLAPADPGCYLFLLKVYDHFPRQADAVIERFRRFAELQPENAQAQYYYAMSLWKGRQDENSASDLDVIEALLRKSIALDGGFAETHYQLANLYADRQEYGKAVPEYERALRLNPAISDAHYRLGRYYARLGDKDRSQQEIALYQKFRAQAEAEGDKQGAEVRRFDYSADAAAAKP